MKIFLKFYFRPWFRKKYFRRHLHTTQVPKIPTRVPQLPLSPSYLLGAWAHRDLHLKCQVPQGAVHTKQTAGFQALLSQRGVSDLFPISRGVPNLLSRRKCKSWSCATRQTKICFSYFISECSVYVIKLLPPLPHVLKEQNKSAVHLTVSHPLPPPNYFLLEN